MKILLTGANGYIGSRLLLHLLDADHEVIALVRHPHSFQLPSHKHLTIIYADLLDINSLKNIPEDIDIAYYLVHAMSYGKKDFPALEEQAASNFLESLKKTKVKQIIYLSGLINDKHLSAHLTSRYKTECLIKKSGFSYTILRAGIIIGSGSASFEIIRDLVDKLPVMVAPKWVNNRCQPISIMDVLGYLQKILLHPQCLNQVFDIGGPDVLSYKEMLLTYAKVRDLKRYIFVVPVLTPRLSSYWLYFVTSVNYQLASSLVDSVKNEAICSENRILEIFSEPCLNYELSVRKALDLVEQNPFFPGWKDSLFAGTLESNLSNLSKVPSFGCLIDQQTVDSQLPVKELMERVWSIGGDKGWYCMDWAWVLRGFIDKLVGGTGLNRGRSHPTELQVGSSLDFWRVLISDKEHGNLLLYAEMKVPGEAWLQFTVSPTSNGSQLKQIASFRPKGVLGRLYWYLLLPIHTLIFRGMAYAIANPSKKT